MKIINLFVIILLFPAMNACSQKAKVNADAIDLLQIEKAIFTDPEIVKNQNNDPAIMDALIKYIDNTPKEAVIHIDVCTFGYKPLIEAIGKAYKRGVEIHIMADGSKSKTLQYNIHTLAPLMSLFNAPSEIVLVNNDAASGVNHSKYALFSKVNLLQGEANDLVFVTSQNFKSSGNQKAQDAVIMSNNALYNSFVDNWHEIRSRSKSGMKNFTYTINDIGDSITVYFLPRRINGEWDGGDPILEILGKLSGDYTKDTICVFMSGFSRSKIAEELTRLRKKGAIVGVITKGWDGSKPVNTGAMPQLELLEKAGGYLKVLDIQKRNVHSKVMLIKGMWDGRLKKIVVMGSHNYTYNSLKNDNEVILMLKNSTLFDNYWSYFRKLKKIF